jgi:hypothetical protein
MGTGGGGMPECDWDERVDDGSEWACLVGGLERKLRFGLSSASIVMSLSDVNSGRLFLPMMGLFDVFGVGLWCERVRSGRVLLEYIGLLLALDLSLIGSAAEAAAARRRVR